MYELPEGEVIVAYSWQGTRKDGEIAEAYVDIQGEWWVYLGYHTIADHEAKASTPEEGVREATTWLEQRGFRSKLDWDGPKLEY